MNANQQQFAMLLQHTADALDVPEEMDRRLRAAYDDLSRWFEAHQAGSVGAGASVYVQGSRRLGTMVPPVKATDDLDVDVVYCRDLARNGITQEQLKSEAGIQLRNFVSEIASTGGEAPSLSEGGRCWTLQYPRGFHMDVLPSLPDDDASRSSSLYPEHGIIITDRELRRWQPSNPKGYALWFRSCMTAALAEARAAMAKATNVDVEEIPEHTVKTHLQRIVQLLKRHRDIRYSGNPDDKPISIIITTLAALSFSTASGRDLSSLFLEVTSQMPTLVQRSSGLYWIPNPVDPRENFADKWNKHPERAVRFFEWLAQVASDTTAAIRSKGLDHVVQRLGGMFGDSYAEAAANRYGGALLESRESGTLRASSGRAMLGSTGALQVAPHTFYGDIHET